MTEQQTHFGFRQVAEGDKARHVAGVFSSVAQKYDVMNDLMSLGLHRLWKQFAIQIAGVRTGERILDVAGGTADLARAFAKRVGAFEKTGGQVWLTDINNAMLTVGRDRLLDQGVLLPVAQCDAEQLPFPKNDADSYRYLAESIRMHPDQETLKNLMERVGLEHVEYFNLTAGVVALHRGYKL
ncbi:MAG: class I SAM-dependent methyltransferase [Proteobacteria bacterium]|nr:class I SAM-dependent methyltransferase [Pseudomonadota bacterium]